MKITPKFPACKQLRWFLVPKMRTTLCCNANKMGKTGWELFCEVPTSGAEKCLIGSVHNFWQHKTFLHTSFGWIIRKKITFLWLVYFAVPWTGTCVALCLMVYELEKVRGSRLMLKMSDEAWLLWLVHFVQFPSLRHLPSFFFERNILENQKASLLIL